MSEPQPQKKHPPRARQTAPLRGLKPQVDGLKRFRRDTARRFGLDRRVGTLPADFEDTFTDQIEDLFDERDDGTP